MKLINNQFFQVMKIKKETKLKNNFKQFLNTR